MIDITKQELKNRNNLFKLMKDNPKLPVIPMVDNDVVADDSFKGWMGALGESWIAEYYIGEDQVHFRDDGDCCEIERTLMDGVIYYDDFDLMSEPEMKKVYIELPWEKAIFVSVEAVPTTLLDLEI